jgi:hypothetical protein
MRSCALLLVLAACTSSPSDPAQGSEPGASDPGPRSGLAGDTRVTDLSAPEREQLCTWWAETLGGVGRSQFCTECDGDACTDWTSSVSKVEDCVAWLESLEGIEATVNDAENCAFAEQPDLCAFPSACDPFD